MIFILRNCIDIYVCKPRKASATCAEKCDQSKWIFGTDLRFFFVILHHLFPLSQQNKNLQSTTAATAAATWQQTLLKNLQRNITAGANATATAAPPISSPSGTSVTPYLTQLQKSLQTGYNLPQPGTSIYTLSQLSNLEFVQKQLSVKQFLEKNFGRKVENNVEVQGQSQSKTSLKRSRDDNDHEQEKDDENSPTSSKKPKTEGETRTENTEVFVNDSDEEIDVIKCDEEGSKIRSFSIDSIISR